MKQLIILIAALVLVGCGESQQMNPTEEAKPVDPVAEVPTKPPSPVESQTAETVAEAVNLEAPKAKAPNISIHDAANFGNIESIKEHIAAGTDVDAKDKDKFTSLRIAAWRGHKEIAELLIAAGADVNANRNGWTPLHYASLDGHKEIVELLVAKGANINAKVLFGQNEGKTPLDAANEDNRTEIADLLRKHGGKTGEELKAEGK